VALLNDRDDHHERCRDFLANYSGPLLIPTTMFTEVCMLAERRRGTRAELLHEEGPQAGSSCEARRKPQWNARAFPQ
jgi:uncharacterized protein